MQGHRVYLGMALRDALRLAERLGCRVVDVRGTGEIRVSHGSMARRVRLNARRRDAPRRLVDYLRHLLDPSTVPTARRPGPG